MNFLLIAWEGNEAMWSARLGGSSPSAKNPTRVPKGADGKPLTLTTAAFDANFSGKRKVRRK